MCSIIDALLSGNTILLRNHCESSAVMRYFLPLPPCFCNMCPNLVLCRVDMCVLIIIDALLYCNTLFVSRFVSVLRALTSLVLFGEGACVLKALPQLSCYTFYFYASRFIL